MSDMNGNTMVITPEDQMNWDTIAELRKELDTAQSGAVGLNIRIAELHKQLADAKADWQAENEALNVLRSANRLNLQELEQAKALLDECVGFIEPRYPDFGSPALYVKVVEFLNKWRAK